MCHCHFEEQRGEEASLCLRCTQRMYGIDEKNISLRRCIGLFSKDKKINSVSSQPFVVCKTSPVNSVGLPAMNKLIKYFIQIQIQISDWMSLPPQNEC